MDTRLASILNIVLGTFLIIVVDQTEHLIPFDVYLIVGMLFAILISSTVGSYFSDDQPKLYLILSIAEYILIGGIGAILIYSTCNGLGCLGATLLIVSIPIVAIIFSIGTFLGNLLK